MSDDDDKLVVLDPGRVTKRHAPAVHYSEQLAVEICEAIGSTNLGIETLCRLHRGTWPNVTTVFRWRRTHIAFDQAFAVAEAARASRFMHQLVEIADDDSRDLILGPDGKTLIPNMPAVRRDNLRITTRLEAAKRFDPQNFGDRIEQNRNVRVGFIPLDEAIHQLK